MDSIKSFCWFLSKLVFLFTIICSIFGFFEVFAYWSCVSLNPLEFLSILEFSKYAFLHIPNIVIFVVLGSAIAVILKQRSELEKERNFFFLKLSWEDLILCLVILFISIFIKSISVLCFRLGVITIISIILSRLLMHQKNFYELIRNSWFRQKVIVLPFILAWFGAYAGLCRFYYQAKQIDSVETIEGNTYINKVFVGELGDSSFFYDATNGNLTQLKSDKIISITYTKKQR